MKLLLLLALAACGRDHSTVDAAPGCIRHCVSCPCAGDGG